jgi:hypothetical protein
MELSQPLAARHEVLARLSAGVRRAIAAGRLQTDMVELAGVAAALDLEGQLANIL